MQGSGGMVTAERAADKPIGTLSSGPAAGAIAAAKIGAQAGLADIVTFDVGGTRTDVALIHGGQPYLSHAEAGRVGAPRARADARRRVGRRRRRHRSAGSTRAAR